jgi:hypothetical protein
LNATLPGISKHTVDQRLRLATTHIGAGSKFGAARCFYAVEAEGRNQQLAFRDPLLFRANYVDANDAKIDEQDCNKGELAAKADLKLQDIQSPYRFGDETKLEALLSVSVSQDMSPTPPIGLRTGLFVGAGLSIILLLAFGAAVAGLAVLSRFGR